MKISVVYPAYNEVPNLKATLERSIQALKGLTTDYEIIVVNDCSTDHTLKLLQEMAIKNRHLRVISNPSNMGPGASVLRGFAAATGDYVIHNGMDYPFDLQELERMLPLLSRADIVVGVRSGRQDYSLLRKLTSLINRTLLRILFPLKLADYNFVQLYKPHVLHDIRVESRSASFVIPELMIRAKIKGYSFAEVQVTYYPRPHGSSILSKPKVILHGLRDLLLFRIKLWFPGSDSIKP